MEACASRLCSCNIEVARGAGFRGGNVPSHGSPEKEFPAFDVEAKSLLKSFHFRGNIRAAGRKDDSITATYNFSDTFTGGRLFKSICFQRD